MAQYSFSFSEILTIDKIDQSKVANFEATDGLKLAYYSFKTLQPVATLIFIHGGGAHSGAGYQKLAIDLSRKYKIDVYLLDLRGHGQSEGARGDTPTKEQLFKDIKSFSEGMKQEGVPLYLGGHSSGGGLLVNYFSYYPETIFDGYIFVSPEFGYKSNTAKNDIQAPFAKINTKIFVVNAMSRGAFLGNKSAVSFNYPEEILNADPLLLKSISCNMALALTPSEPQTQFANLDKPFALFVGDKDELFDPVKLLTYSELPKGNPAYLPISHIIKNENHLSILLKAGDLIGETIQKWIFAVEK
ncbi:alpha/beta fold hydrolase [Viridibacillus arvi]|uniref:alpha/beta fold hydrolase n=1 Tax=Viridibacillus arvi TaxID=263475 RepID=UPI003697AFB1